MAPQNGRFDKSAPGAGTGVNTIIAGTLIGGRISCVLHKATNVFLEIPFTGTLNFSHIPSSVSSPVGACTRAEAVLGGYQRHGEDHFYICPRFVSSRSRIQTIPVVD